MRRGEVYRTKLTHFVSTLSATKLAQLNRALAHALELQLGSGSISPLR